ncbi:uncharacterized protein GJ701_009928 isoform 1-T1 [Geothlypis trichas]
MDRGAEDQKSLEAAKLLDQMLSDLERRREMKRKAVLKAAFPGGSSGSLAATAAGREVMPSTGTGDESAGMALPAARMEDGLEPLGASAEMEGEAVLKAQFPGGSRGSLAASAAGREAMPGTVPGDWDHRMAYMEKVVNDSMKNLGHGGGKFSVSHP